MGTLEHLLKIEAEAAALVSNAQTEIDRRIRENEEKNRIAFEEYYKAEILKQQELLKIEKDKVNSQYQKSLDDYREEISCINADERRFSALLNEYIFCV